VHPESGKRGVDHLPRQVTTRAGVTIPNLRAILACKKINAFATLCFLGFQYLAARFGSFDEPLGSEACDNAVIAGRQEVLAERSKSLRR